MIGHNTTPPIPGDTPLGVSLRLSMRDTAVVLGITVGDVLKRRNKVGKSFDAQFPAMGAGSFSEAEVLAYKQATARLIASNASLQSPEPPINP